MMKKILFYMRIFLLFILLTACASGEKEGKKEEGDHNKKENIKIVAGNIGGTYFPLGENVTEVIEKETDLKVEIFTSEGAVDNIQLLQEKEFDIAFTQVDIASSAQKGEKMFDKKIKNIKGIGILYPEAIQIVTAEQSSIQSVADLKGKTVAVGELGSGTYRHAEQILALHDLTLDEVDIRTVSFDDATVGMEDGTIDAAFITAGIPTGAIEGLISTKKLKFIPLEDEKVEEFIRTNPNYEKERIPKDVYKLEDDVPTIATKALLVVHQDVPEDTVYTFTKTLYENIDKITHKIGEKINKETALEELPVDLHEGAKKYFVEIGLEVE